MSAVGPELPPHLLAKRKRQLDDDDKVDAGPSSGAKRSKTPDVEDKRPRVLGPAPPPAPLDKRPATAANDEEDSSDEDDDFGPSLPMGPEATAQAETTSMNDSLEEPQAPAQSGRDAWMTMPPKQDDLAARMDPSKVRARGFNTGKGAKAPGASDGDNSIWTETPEQKRKRLQDEVMGVKATGAEQGTGRDYASERKRAEDEAAAAKIREHMAQTRGKSLYQEHQSSHSKEKEDDPSKRAFDREKDIGGMKINNTQRKEMLNKAAGFSSKFSGGSFL